MNSRFSPKACFCFGESFDLLDEFLQLRIPRLLEKSEGGWEDPLDLFEEVHFRVWLACLKDSDQTREFVFDDGDLNLLQRHVLEDDGLGGALLQVALERGLVLVLAQPILQRLAGCFLLFNPAGPGDRNGRDLGDGSPRTTQIDHSDGNLI